MYACLKLFLPSEETPGNVKFLTNITDSVNSVTAIFQACMSSCENFV